MPGDAPLVRPELLARLATVHRESDAAVTLLTSELAPWTWSFGRVVRDRQGRVDRIVERTDATADELELTEVNTSIYCFRRSLLAPALRRSSPENAQGEYYLTDAVAVLRETGHPVVAVAADDPAAARHVNDRAQLATAEAVLRERINERWMIDGVTMVDPSAVYIDTMVELAPDVRLLPGTILEGRTTIASGAVVGPDTRLVDTVVHERAVVQQTVARESVIGEACTVGPFVSLRAGTHLGRGRARRHVRRDQERRHRRGGEGAAPLLHGRRRDRSARQRRCGHDHRELRREAEASVEDRRRRADRLQHRARRAGRGRRRRLHGRGLGGEPCGAAGIARRGVPARVDEEWAGRHAGDDVEDTDEPGDRTGD